MDLSSAMDCLVFDDVVESKYWSMLRECCEYRLILASLLLSACEIYAACAQSSSSIQETNYVRRSVLMWSSIDWIIRQRTSHPLRWFEFLRIMSRTLWTPKPTKSPQSQMSKHSGTSISHSYFLASSRCCQYAPFRPRPFGPHTSISTVHLCSRSSPTHFCRELS